MSKKYSTFAITCVILTIAICIELTRAVMHVAVTASADANAFVLIDPGHGGEDGGAVGVNGVYEKDINLRIALIVRDLCEQSGIKTEMTRSGDYSIGDENLDTIASRKASDIKKRVEICNNSHPNLLLSIHQNHFSQEKYSGAQVFYGIKDGSESLAKSIQEEIRNDIQPDNQRKIKPTDKGIYILNHVDVPSVIVECGFISNNKEAELLTDDEYCRGMAYSIYLGILKYMSL